MAEDFLDALPEALDLPSDSSCMICLERYGVESSIDGILERAVLLPCNHHIGTDCISIWVCEEGKTTCPMCRARLFATPSQSYLEYMGQEIIGEDGLVLFGLFRPPPPHDVDGYPDLYDPSGFTRIVARMIEEAGRPLGAQEGRPGAEGEQSRNQQVPSPNMYVNFLQRSTEEYSESFRRARAIESTPVPSPPGLPAFSEEWGQEQQAHGVTSDEIAAERSDRTNLWGRRVERFARSFRLLSFREFLLYLHLVYDGAQLPQLAFPIRPLNPEQEEALFLEIERRGAFAMPGEFYDEHTYFIYPMGTNRQRWQTHRETFGQVYNPVYRRWI